MKFGPIWSFYMWFWQNCLWQLLDCYGRHFAFTLRSTNFYQNTSHFKFEHVFNKTKRLSKTI